MEHRRQVEEQKTLVEQRDKELKRSQREKEQLESNLVESQELEEKMTK